MLIAKSLVDCYFYDTWSFMYFVQYLLSHVPFIGPFLLENSSFDFLLSINLVKFNQDISKYLLVGSVGASLGNILFEIYSDFNIKPFYGMNADVMGGGQNPAGPQGGQQPQGDQQPQGGQQGGQQPQGGGAFIIQGGRYNVTDPSGMSHRGYIDPRTRRPFPT
jgi:hypothetical protein